MTTTELERLRQWKAEAMPVIDGLQEVGRALGLPLGSTITGREAVDAALDLHNRAAKEARNHEAAYAALVSIVNIARERGQVGSLAIKAILATYAAATDSEGVSR